MKKTGKDSEKRNGGERISVLAGTFADRREPRNDVICPKKLRSQVWKFMVGHVVGNLKFNIQRGRRLCGRWSTARGWDGKGEMVGTGVVWHNTVH